MSSETARRTRAAVAAAALLVVLTGCAGLPFSSAQPGAGSMPPSGVVSERCGVNSERLSGFVDDSVAKLGSVQEAVLDGKVPDFAELFAPLQTDLRSFAEGTTDPEVLTALEDVQTAMAGFAELPAPQNVLEAAGFVQEFTAQVQELRDAGTALQRLCTAP